MSQIPAQDPFGFPTLVHPRSSGSEAVVAVQQVSKVFKDFWRRDRARAVNQLTFEVRPREIFGLLGPNGSGKSTTIKMILGLLRPSMGRIAIFGKSPTDVAVKKRIGYLPEESYLYGFLNARETLEYYAKLFEIDYRTRERRIDELLDMIGLASAQFRPVREYSKGMQRRIGIAQALINDPDFLILDEPTTGLDPLGTRQVKDLIIQLGKRGKTVLLSSHLLADVEDCVDRLVILYGGQKRAEGTCDELLVAQDRTSIETDALDDRTIAAVDQLLRAESGGERSVRRITKPRQSLEELFLDIVEQAKAEQVATSGATAGGETASFLKAEEDGEQLIEGLVNASREESRPAPIRHVSAPMAPTGPDSNVIGQLLRPAEPDKASDVRSPGAPAAPLPTKGIDLSVIGSLIEKPPQGGEKQP
ncbi:MAG: ABC transporter ATP-binding protein [Phycisphaerales bacterium]